jgi:uncharacterized protein involved in high-affinity Fe2+ transport
MANTTDTALPPMKPSEESTAEQLELARRQGTAYAAALEAMNQESGAQVRRVGDVEVAVVVENAEGMWMRHGDDLRWENPGDENAHVEVAVRDAADGRFIPGLSISVTLTAPDGTDVGTHTQPFLWHPWLYHYGRNWVVPGEGDYRVRVKIDPPEFMRHDYENGNRYADPIETEFSVAIKPGQKLAP